MSDVIREGLVTGWVRVSDIVIHDVTARLMVG